MTTNAPVQFKIVRPLSQTPMPTNKAMWHAAATTFDGEIHRVYITLPYESTDGVIRGSMTGLITALKYESGSPGMLLFEMHSPEKRWIKIHGFYNAHPRNGANYGFIIMTPSR